MPMHRKPVTMSDVAKRAGVSSASASVVLHGSGGNTRVGEDARQRILRAARELQYTRNALAKALRQQRTDIIGLYLGDWLVNTHNLFLAEIVSGLQLGCHKHRKDLLIHGTFRGRSVDDIYGELINGKIDGLVIFAKENDPLLPLLAAASVPVIAVADAVPALPSVVVDDAAGSILIADYLAGKGHIRVLYCLSSTVQLSARRRYDAFRACAVRHGMNLADYDNDGAVDTLRDPGAFRVTLAANRPTAVVCSTDLLAYAVVDWCRDNGLRVPRDVAVAGFDGIAGQVRPASRLTTVGAPWSLAAQMSVDLLAQRLRGEEIPSETVLPVELIVGETA